MGDHPAFADGRAYALALSSRTVDGQEILVSEIDSGVFLKSKATMYAILTLICRKGGLGFADLVARGGHKVTGPRGLKMNGPTQANRYQQKAVRARFTLRGIYVVRLLAGMFLALDIALVLTIVYAPSGLPGYRLQNREVRKMENTVLKLRIENQKLFKLIQSIKTNPEVQERLVRRQLGWVGKNEVIFESPGRTESGNSGPIRPFDFAK
ncbi:MAG: septum formation initiator family protein [Deltaproteobacteria bacterium]|jgi:cell division protein FtsB|nr:septum formation initiator family protein [Deltaproteobacteria bacterium]